MSEQDVKDTAQDEAEVEGHLLKESLIAGLAAAAIAAPAHAKPADPGTEAPSVIAAQTLEQTSQQKAQKGKKVAPKRTASNPKKPLPPIEG